MASSSGRCPVCCMVADLCECDDEHDGGDSVLLKCCYVSERGACGKVLGAPGPGGARRPLCPMHTCPICGDTKPSREKDCGCKEAGGGLSRRRSSARGSTRGRQADVVAAVRAKNGDLDKVRAASSNFGQAPPLQPSPLPSLPRPRAAGSARAQHAVRRPDAAGSGARSLAPMLFSPCPRVHG